MHEVLHHLKQYLTGQLYTFVTWTVNLTPFLDNQASFISSYARN